MVLLKHILVLGLWIGAILAAHGLGVFFHHTWQTPIHRYWPMSIFLFKRPFLIDGLTLVSLCLLMAGVWQGYRRNWSIGVLTLGIFVIMIGTNLLQGVDEGWVRPVLGVNASDYGYWQDAAVIQSAPDFIRHYVWLQPTLGYHSRVHPPGVVLLFWGLRQVWDTPIFVSVILAAMAALGCVAVHFLVRVWFNKKTATYIALIYGMLPAVQIYGLASIDGVIAGVFTATLWAAYRKRWWVTVLFLWVASALTFGVVWLGPLVMFISWQHGKQLWWSVKIFLGVGLLWALTFLVTGYAYWDSFFVAASFEGSSHGLWMLAQPDAYVLSRIEDVLEPLVFLGPFIVLLLSAGLRPWKRFFGAVGLAKVAMATFLVFLSTGAYYTGETARAALYVIPPVLMVVAWRIEREKWNPQLELRLLLLVFLQTVVMQLFGWYAW